MPERITVNDFSRPGGGISISPRLGLGSWMACDFDPFDFTRQEGWSTGRLMPTRDGFVVVEEAERSPYLDRVRRFSPGGIVPRVIVPVRRIRRRA